MMRWRGRAAVEQSQEQTASRHALNNPQDLKGLRYAADALRRAWQWEKYR